MLACKEGDVFTVMELLKNGDDVNNSDGNNNTALMYAIVSDIAKSETNPNHMLIIKKLIEHGAELNAVNMQFETPLILAVKNKDPESLETLLKAGANNFEVMDLDGGTIFSYAAEDDNKNCKVVLDTFKNRPQPAAAAPASRSFLTRALDVVLSPFRLIGRVVGEVIKTVAAAVVQFFINRSAKPRASSDVSDDINDYQEMSDQIDNPKTVTKLTSKPEETSTKKKYDPKKEKKVHIFTDKERAEMEGGRNRVRGVTPPGSPKSPKQEI